MIQRITEAGLVLSAENPLEVLVHAREVRASMARPRSSRTPTAWSYGAWRVSP